MYEDEDIDAFLDYFDDREPMSPAKGSSKPTKPCKAVGGTYDASLDGKRLGSLLEAVERVMRDGAWHTLLGIKEACGQGSETGIGARLRELRQQGHTVDRRRVEGQSGLWEYRLASAPATPKYKPFQWPEGI